MSNFKPYEFNEDGKVVNSGGPTIEGEVVDTTPPVDSQPSLTDEQRAMQMAGMPSPGATGMPKFQFDPDNPPPLYARLRIHAMMHKDIHLNCTVFTKKTEDGKGICNCRFDDGSFVEDHWNDEAMKAALDTQLGQYLKPKRDRWSERAFTSALRLDPEILRDAGVK